MSRYVLSTTRQALRRRGTALAMRGLKPELQPWHRGPGPCLSLLVGRCYHDTHYQRSIDQKEEFWLEAAHDLDWFERPPEHNVISLDKNKIHRWFAGGKLNTCYLALDVHVDKYDRGDQVALIWDSPVTGRKAKYTYREMRDSVAKLAAVLDDQGVKMGDRVMIYMPMIPEAIMTMLACARIGAVHSVVFGGFAPKEVVTRLNDLQPKVVVTANYGVEGTKVINYKTLLDEALANASHKPDRVIVYHREEKECPLPMTPGRDVLWHDLMANTTRCQPCVVLDSTDPLYILHTSGTTGAPKGIVRDNGGHAVALKWSMRSIFDTHEGEVFFAGSDVGWVVGHSYICYGPLLKGCTTICYEGKPVRTPDAGAFWRIIDEYKVKTIFAAPTAVRAIRKEDPEALLMKKYDLSSLAAFFLAGERLDAATYEWLDKKLPDVDVVDNWWQTESGWPMVANPLGIKSFEPKVGSSTVAMPGYDMRVLSDEGVELSRGELGNLVIKLPLPPAFFPTVWNDHERKVKSYLTTFPGFYETGDYGYIDDHGYVFILGRVDDVINVAGHRLSTGQMEEIVSRHPAVAEAAVIGIADELKGEIPHGFVVLKDGAHQDALQEELVQAVRHDLGAIACFKDVTVVQRLPKTKSGKILRKTMRKMCEGQTVPTPATIEDPSVLDELLDVIKSDGIGAYAKNRPS